MSISLLLQNPINPQFKSDIGHPLSAISGTIIVAKPPYRNSVTMGFICVLPVNGALVSYLVRQKGGVYEAEVKSGSKRKGIPAFIRLQKKEGRLDRRALAGRNCNRHRKRHRRS